MSVCTWVFCPSFKSICMCLWQWLKQSHRKFTIHIVILIKEEIAGSLNSYTSGCVTIPVLLSVEVNILSLIISHKPCFIIMKWAWVIASQLEYQLLAKIVPWSYKTKLSAVCEGVQKDRNPWSCDDQKGYSPAEQCFLWAYLPKSNNSLCHNCPTHLSHKCPIPISDYVFTSHLIHVWKFSHNEHQCASGVGAPPLDTQLCIHSLASLFVLCALSFLAHILLYFFLHMVT